MNHYYSMVPALNAALNAALVLVPVLVLTDSIQLNKDPYFQALSQEHE